MRNTLKRIVLALFAALATLGVLANDLLPVSAPILAVERSGHEVVLAAPPPVPAQAKAPEIVWTNEPVAALFNAANFPLQNAETGKDLQVAAVETPSSAQHKTGLRPERSNNQQPKLYFSEWLDVPAVSFEKATFLGLDSERPSSYYFGQPEETTPNVDLQSLNPAIQKRTSVEFRNVARSMPTFALPSIAALSFEPSLVKRLSQTTLNATSIDVDQMVASEKLELPEADLAELTPALAGPSFDPVASSMVSIAAKLISPGLFISTGASVLSSKPNLTGFGPLIQENSDTFFGNVALSPPVKNEDILAPVVERRYVDLSILTPGLSTFSERNSGRILIARPAEPFSAFLPEVFVPHHVPALVKRVSSAGEEQYRTPKRTDVFDLGPSLAHTDDRAFRPVISSMEKVSSSLTLPDVFIPSFDPVPMKSSARPRADLSNFVPTVSGVDAETFRTVAASLEPIEANAPAAVDLSAFNPGITHRGDEVFVPATSSFSSMTSSLVGPTVFNTPFEPKLLSRPLFAADRKTEAVVRATSVPVTAKAVSPALITSQTLFSNSMLKPMKSGGLPPTGTSSISADARPSSSAPADQSDGKTLSAAENAKKPIVSSPVLITGNTTFSPDLLKPLNSGAAKTRPLYQSTSLLPDSNQVTTQQQGYCDPNFVGPPIRFTQTVELRLEDLLNQLNARFGVNFIIGPDVGKLPLNVRAGSIPWNVLLRSQLYVSGVRATCIDSNTIELVLNDEVASLEKGRTDAERLQTRYIKLKYLQPSSSGNKNVAGQSSSGSSFQGGGGQGTQCQQQGGGQQANNQSIPQRCKFERLMNEIRQILGITGQGPSIIRTESGTADRSGVTTTADIVRQPYVGQVPGRNMLLVNAAPSQHAEIAELIRYADIPPFQVVIKGLVYTANEDKLKDYGVQTTITDLGGGRTTGGVFGHTLGQLGTLFDFSTLIGTVDFNVQVSALQRDGVITIKSRPFATVLDGDTTDLTVGRQVPVLVQAINPIGGLPGTLQILQAANLLSVTPHVIDDENGNPTAVNLEMQLESNDVDTSVISQGVPSVSVRSIQSNFILNQEQTAILGGFTVDSDSKTISKTPLLGDIPILGELFKRRVRAQQINRLYFAISVTVIPYGSIIEPVTVPGADPDPPTLTPELLKRADKAEPKQVVAPQKKPNN